MAWQACRVHDGKHAPDLHENRACDPWPRVHSVDVFQSWFSKRDDVPAKRVASRRPAFPSGLRSSLPSTARPIRRRPKTLQDITACMQAKNVGSRAGAIEILEREHLPGFERFPADEARPVSTCRTVRVRLPPREYKPLVSNHSTSFRRCQQAFTSLERYLLGFAH